MFSKYFADRDFRVIGYDLSQRMIELARKKVPHAHFFQMDMRKLDTASEAFDGLLCLYSFFLLDLRDAQQALAEFRRVLKKNGVMMINFQEGTGARFIPEPTHATQRTYYMQFYRIAEAQRLLEKARFTVLRCDIRDPVSNEMPHRKIFFTVRK